MNTTHRETSTLDLAQAAHNLRVTARNYAHDDDRDALAALEAVALRYADAHAGAADHHDT